MATETSRTGGRKTAGALDIRNIIGTLLSIYGVILILMGIFGDKQADKTGDVNANLWAGVGLLVAGLIFLAWAKIRPVVVPADVHAHAQDDRPPAVH